MLNIFQCLSSILSLKGQYPAAKFAMDDVTHDIWKTVSGNKFGYNKTKTTGADSIFFMTHVQIKNIPNNQVITYAPVAIDYYPQKGYSNRVRLKASGNLIIYPDELMTKTADIMTVKIMWNCMLVMSN